MRYLFHAIPSLFIAFAMMLALLDRYRYKKNIKRVFNLLIFISFFIYLSINIIRLKNQVMLNIKHHQDPWNYLSIVELNKYFNKKPTKKKKPVVISAFPPYFIDFYSNGNYRVFPLSPHQEFRDHKKEAWGDYDYTDIFVLYKKFIKEGADVYVQNYGIGHVYYLIHAYDEMEKLFIFKQVTSGCYNSCNIYKLEPIKSEL